jgi:hypothetical protein
MAKQSSIPPTPGKGKSAWKARSDVGPHSATLPSGQEVSFVVPDSNALITAQRLPAELTEIAVYAAAYPDGVEGYVNDLSVRVAMSDQPEAAAKLAKAVSDTIALGHWLVAHMLVEPELEPEDVTELPPMDVRMLLEFAERKRDTDAEGVRLPISLLEEYARFLREPGRAPADDNGGGEHPGVPAADRGADEG